MESFSQFIDEISTFLVVVVLLSIVSAITTFIYWISGGSFHRSPELAIYSMVMVYMWGMVFKIAREKHAERLQKPEPCRICGCLPDRK
jgi:TRAP-type C4-dicarboxylate transport system permease small subunit